ncbi:putative oxidoreductase [Thermocatellispora tengchongensis]|uniref:Putative oxidoreductase n=1 Tax=Thermocatellispora tengchongensis TaxID=1073253 RepID=A0A840P1A8_9ACTN|nr:DoxX family protein [Thermocatellispora tengchongensis]MBB5135044.1 putative oxidoreductase [Thermocatellispora tengchongensis]
MRQTAYDVAALVARIVLGVVLLAHGLQKATVGMGRTIDGFEEMGVPLPPVSAAFAMIVEIGAGVLLILGLFTPLAGVLVLVNMLGAFLFVHREAGVFVREGGWELVAMIGLLGLLLAAGGAGRYSLDHVLFGRRGGFGFGRRHSTAPHTVAPPLDLPRRDNSGG